MIPSENGASIISRTGAVDMVPYPERLVSVGILLASRVTFMEYVGRSTHRIGEAELESLGLIDAADVEEELVPSDYGISGYDRHTGVSRTVRRFSPSSNLNW